MCTVLVGPVAANASWCNLLITPTVNVMLRDTSAVGLAYLRSTAAIIARQMLVRYIAQKYSAICSCSIQPCCFMTQRADAADWQVSVEWKFSSVCRLWYVLSRTKYPSLVYWPRPVLGILSYWGRHNYRSYNHIRRNWWSWSRDEWCTERLQAFKVEGLH